MEKKLEKRFWEIDFLRGIAIIMMIIFHILFDLDYFDIYKINMNSGNLHIFNYLIVIIFLLLVGISLTLSISRVNKIFSKKKLILKFVKRGLKIFFLGILISITTYIFLDEGYVIFGVLHLIGISIIIAYPFLRFKNLNLFIGIIIIIFGIYLDSLIFDFPWFIWLGLQPSGIYSLDFLPILPWFGFVLIGIFLGHNLYTNYERNYEIRDKINFPLVKLFSLLGRHSLKIYFIHHIVIISLVYLYLSF